MITATFSNGQTDVYKGDRAVKAAWQVITANGEMFSGHSLDSATAEKTARSYLTRGCDIRLIDKYTSLSWAVKIATEAGFKTTRQYNVYAKAKRAEYASQGKVEIVSL